MKYIVFFSSLFLGSIFLSAGLDKFFHFMSTDKFTKDQKILFELLEEIKWLLPLVGTFEIIGSILFMIPKTRALGAIVILPILMGVIVNNLTTVPRPSVLILTFILTVIDFGAIYLNSEKYLQLVD